MLENKDPRVIQLIEEQSFLGIMNGSKIKVKGGYVYPKELKSK